MLKIYLFRRRLSAEGAKPESNHRWKLEIRVRSCMYRVSGKKRYSPLCLVFQSACVDFFETCHNCRLKNGKKDECKINAFVMLSNIDMAICVETYFSTKSFGQTRRPLIKKLGWDHRKTRLAPNNATISRWVKKFRDGRLFRRKQGSGRPRTARSEESIRQAERSVWEERSVRAVVCSPSERSSRPSVPISSKSGSSRMAPLLIPLLHRVSGSRSASLAGSLA